MRTVASVLSRLLGALDLTDLLAVGGLAAVGAGLWMVYPPAALIVVGAILLVISLAGSMR